MLDGQAELTEIVAAFGAREAWRTFCTPNKSKPAKIAMIVMTISNSTMVKPGL